MTSQINTANINTAYPVAGADNDSQGFRDNFLNIKAAVDVAASEITTLQLASSNVSVVNFGADPTGVIDSTGAIDQAYQTSKQLNFPEGIYKVSGLPNFAVAGTRIRGIGNVVINYTGANECMFIDGGSASSIVYNVTIENLTLNAAISATTGLRIRAIGHSSFKDIRITNFTTTAALCQYMMSNTFENIVYSSNESELTHVAVNGLQLDQRNSGEKSSNCKFTNVVMEGTTGTGINLVSAIACSFDGGASSNNVTGISVGTLSFGNTFVGLGMEANSTADIACAGHGTIFENCVSDSLCSILASNATTLIGGQYTDITIDAAAKGTALVGVSCINLPSDSSDTTSQVGTFDSTLSQPYTPSFSQGIVLGKIDTGSVLTTYNESTAWTPNATSLAVSGTPSYVGKYSQVGNIVFWTVAIQSTVSTTSTAGVSTITLPFAAASPSTCNAASVTTGIGYLAGVVTGSTCYLPSWSADASVIVTGSFFSS